VVDTLVEIGHINGERVQHAKQLYERLHSVLVGAMQQEKSLLEQARQLAKEAQVMLVYRRCTGMHITMDSQEQHLQEALLLC
jgi:tRNA G37 N-methylase Trm5